MLIFFLFGTSWFSSSPVYRNFHAVYLSPVQAGYLPSHSVSRSRLTGYTVMLGFFKNLPETEEKK